MLTIISLGKITTLLSYRILLLIVISISWHTCCAVSQITWYDMFTTFRYKSFSLYEDCLKIVRSEKHSPIKVQRLWKNVNMDKWVVSTLNKLFILFTTGSAPEAKFLKLKLVASKTLFSVAGPFVILFPSTHILPWWNFFTKFSGHRRFLTKGTYLVLFLKKKKIKFGPKIPKHLCVSLNWH